MKFYFVTWYGTDEEDESGIEPFETLDDAVDFCVGEIQQIHNGDKNISIHERLDAAIGKLRDLQDGESIYWDEDGRSWGISEKEIGK